MEPTHSRTLVLSQGFEPVNIVSVQRAITLLFLGKVEVIEEYDGNVKTISAIFKTPAGRAAPERVPPPQEGGEVLPREHLRPRQVHLPVLRREEAVDHRADVRPRCPTLARRQDDMDQHRDVLLGLQSQEGEPDAGRGGHEASQGAGAADGYARPDPHDQQGVDARRVERLRVLDVRAGCRLRSGGSLCS